MWPERARDRDVALMRHLSGPTVSPSWTTEDPLTWVTLHSSALLYSALSSPVQEEARRMSPLQAAPPASQLSLHHTSWSHVLSRGRGRDQALGQKGGGSKRSRLSVEHFMSSISEWFEFHFQSKLKWWNSTKQMVLQWGTSKTQTMFPSSQN